MAVDVGASSGNVAFPLLSHGHEVHLFETGITDLEHSQRWLIEMTLKANGWLERATLHDHAGREGSGSYLGSPIGVGDGDFDSLDSVFKDYERVDLLKIDVDSTEEYDDVFGGSLETLKKTTCVEIELIEEEIERHGMLRVAAFMDKQGFDMYLLHALDFNGNVPYMLTSKGDQVDDTPAQLRRGFVLYGENPLTNFTLSPGLGSICDPERRLKAEDAFVERLQHTFIRRGTPMHVEVVKRYGGIDAHNEGEGGCHLPLPETCHRGGPDFCLTHNC